MSSKVLNIVIDEEEQMYKAKHVPKKYDKNLKFKKKQEQELKKQEREAKKRAEALKKIKKISENSKPILKQKTLVSKVKKESDATKVEIESEDTLQDKNEKESPKNNDLKDCNTSAQKSDIDGNQSDDDQKAEVQKQQITTSSGKQLQYKIRQSTFDILSQYQCGFSSQLNGGAKINGDNIDLEITQQTKAFIEGLSQPQSQSQTQGNELEFQQIDLFQLQQQADCTQASQSPQQQKQLYADSKSVPALRRQIQEAYSHDQQHANGNSPDKIKQLNEQEYKPQQQGQSRYRMSKKDYLLERNKQYPKFLLPQNRLDANKKKPNDPLYDPNTLYIPDDDMDKLSAGMKRYWDIKKNSMSQILLYRFGDWYIAYYDDLDACIKLFEMIVVPHPGSYQLGFPQRNLNDNIYLLITNGYKVAICEQTETRDQMEKRQAIEKAKQKKNKPAPKNNKKITDHMQSEHHAPENEETKEEKKQSQLKKNLISDLDYHKQNQTNDQDDGEEDGDMEDDKINIKSTGNPDEKGDNNWKACRREIVGIYTKGTFNPGIVEMQQPTTKRDKRSKSQAAIEQLNESAFDNRYVLVYVRNEQNTRIGFTFFDLTILRFYTGSISSKKQNLLHKFRTLLMQVRPLECVTLHSESSKESIKIVRSIQFSPMIQYMTQSNLPTAADTEIMITRYFTNNISNWPEGLNDLIQNLRKKYDEIGMISLGLSIKYLESLLLADQIIPFGCFYQYEGQSSSAYINAQNHMTLNGNALENLEIFVVNSQSYDSTSNQVVRKTKGSLMDYLDKTCTPYGQRLLRKWVSMPLIDADKIKERQDCIQDLLDNFDLVTRYRAKARKTSHDLERMLSKVYSYSVKAQIHIAYDDLTWNQRLKDFKRVLDLLDELLEVKVEVFEYDKDNFKSEKLKKICTFRSIEGLLQNEQDQTNIEQLSQDPTVQSSITEQIESEIVNEDSQTITSNYQPTQSKKKEDSTILTEQEQRRQNRSILESEDGLFDNFTPILKQFQDNIDWRRVDHDKYMPWPKPGLDEEIDELLKYINECKTQLKEYIS